MTVTFNLGNPGIMRHMNMTQWSAGAVYNLPTCMDNMK